MFLQKEDVGKFFPRCPPILGAWETWGQFPPHMGDASPLCTDIYIAQNNNYKSSS